MKDPIPFRTAGEHLRKSSVSLPAKIWKQLDDLGQKHGGWSPNQVAAYLLEWAVDAYPKCVEGDEKKASGR